MQRRWMSDRVTFQKSACVNMDMIRAYPNPFSKKLFTESETGIAAIELTDITGHIVFEANPVSNNKKIEINTENLYMGIYFLRLSLENDKIILIKLIKE